MNIKIGVNGMSCGHCSKAVKDAFMEIEGVEQVEVSLEDKTATITANVDIAEEVLKAIVEDEGYEFTGIL